MRTSTVSVIRGPAPCCSKRCSCDAAHRLEVEVRSTPRPGQPGGRPGRQGLPPPAHDPAEPDDQKPCRTGLNQRSPRSTVPPRGDSRRPDWRWLTVLACERWRLSPGLRARGDRDSRPGPGSLQRSGPDRVHRCAPVASARTGGPLADRGRRARAVRAAGGGGCRQRPRALQRPRSPPGQLRACGSVRRLATADRIRAFLLPPGRSGPRTGYRLPHGWVHRRPTRLAGQHHRHRSQAGSGLGLASPGGPCAEGGARGQRGARLARLVHPGASADGRTAARGK